MSVEHAPVGRTPGAAHRAGYDEATRERLTAQAQQIVARYPVARSALLPMLHLVQSEDGYVSPRGIALCAQILGLTTAEVSAVATFYTQFKRHPNGTYTVGVCTNTLCAIMGGDAIWEEVAAHLGIGHDETTADGAITLERIECNAACDYAPVVMVNWEFFDNQTPESTVALVDDLVAGRPAHPTRGADTVATFREVSHVLAGFPDGRADEGPSAAAPSLRGTVLARQEGWTAPAFPSDEPAAPAPAASSPASAPSSSSPAAAPASSTASTSTPASSGDAAPKVGEPGSGAERTPTTPADTSPAAKQREQRSDQAKES